MATAEDKLEYAYYRIDEAMAILEEHKGKGWATAHHALDKARFVLNIERPRGDRKPLVKEIEKDILLVKVAAENVFKKLSKKKEG